MTPTSPDQPPAFELPQPTPAEAKAAVPAPESAPLHAEQQSKQAELPGSSLPPLPLPPMVANGQTAAVVPGTPPTVPPTAPSTSTTPGLADDVDLIEKEWVDKAKAIVNSTREDPHQQNKQLNEFKADYMKKRYGKEIRLTDE